jgi:UDP-N-acetylglucosamine--N-acetylmuramyl-(pentapeptide) pyrophosphoryl-undecaprenol N-acetylglucosamine transferase
MRKLPRRIQVVITGGGTGGHVEPALAVGRALGSLGVAAESVLFVGARRGMEARLVPAAGFAVRLLPGRGFVRGPSPANLGAAAGLVAAFVEAFMIMLRSRPSVVVMVGGYAGVACSLAAVICRVPVVVVNVDSEAGKANRLVGRFAVLSAVASAESGLPRSVVTGPPVREDVLAADRSAEGRKAARERFGIDATRRVIAVVGGSLGARRLNDAALELRIALRSRSDLLLYHVAGARNEPELRARVASAPIEAGGIEYRLVAYESSLPSLFAVADLVLARAGAMTVAELAVIGVPSVLVPLPGAPGDHQSVNARSLEARGAAVLLSDSDAHGERLVALVNGLLADVSRLDAMGRAAKLVARPGAAAEIAALVLSAAKPRSAPEPPVASKLDV